MADSTLEDRLAFQKEMAQVQRFRKALELNASLETAEAAPFTPSEILAVAEKAVNQAIEEAAIELDSRDVKWYTDVASTAIFQNTHFGQKLDASAFIGASTQVRVDTLENFAKNLLDTVRRVEAKINEALENL